jgi:hypothetical protein
MPLSSPSFTPLRFTFKDSRRLIGQLFPHSNKGKIFFQARNQWQHFLSNLFKAKQNEKYTLRNSGYPDYRMASGSFCI